MSTKIPIYTVIATLSAYTVFLILYLIFDFYIAQNIIVLIGAIYLSVAWINYLYTDRFLRKNNSLSDSELLEKKKKSKPLIYSLLISAVLTFIIALF